MVTGELAQVGTWATAQKQVGTGGGPRMHGRSPWACPVSPGSPCLVDRARTENRGGCHARPRPGRVPRLSGVGRGGMEGAGIVRGYSERAQRVSVCHAVKGGPGVVASDEWVGRGCSFHRPWRKGSRAAGPLTGTLQVGACWAVAGEHHGQHSPRGLVVRAVGCV